MTSDLPERELRFYAFQHPYVCTFAERLQLDGVAGLLTLENQLWQRDNSAYTDSTLPTLKPPKGPFFQYTYAPNDEVVSKEYPRYRVEFGPSDAYAQYNWELFFHIPLLIATRLMQDERHDEATRWFHYIFNPTTHEVGSVPERYWFFKPFRDGGKPESIKQLLQQLKPAGGSNEELLTAIQEWRDHPFEPHRIARRRPGAYQKTVVMKYLDNLISWGDKLFLRDTIESINEATQLYVLAARLLGQGLYRVPELATPPTMTYAELRPKLDDFSNALLWIEGKSVTSQFTTPASSQAGTGDELPLLFLPSLYFCIPHNEKLLGYWDTVADRLFKIRHCMNIEGVVRELPLFEPPIDPALLVRARALGLDLASVLDDLSAPAPHYRFSFLLQKAREFCEELKQLGSLLLSVLEKRDAEELASVRAGHERALLEAVREVKKQQVKEAEDALGGLEKAKDLAHAREAHYKATSARLPEEAEVLTKQSAALGLKLLSQAAAFGGSVAAAAVPELKVSAAGTCSGTQTTISDPKKVALLAQLVSLYLGWFAEIAGSEASVAQYRGQLIRAQQDRDLQIQLATLEAKQLDKQIAAAEIREQIAERELANHELQMEQAEKIDGFLREKFTNQDLYGWMKGELSAVYFQAYKFAYDLAKRAERAYRMELGIEDSSFIRFGAWDSLRKGLLAGERLSLDLRRLEAAYLDRNKRTYELTRHVSLAQLDPVALVRLRQMGACELTIPEALFDLDYPGHYLRRIKSVSLTIPCVSGPYTGVSCTLTLLKHGVRMKADASKELELEFVALQSIATSSGRNDAGLFELSFRDERRLPFEGAGVVSHWRIELPDKVHQFDYDTISDIVFQLNYTALDGGSSFKEQREGKLLASLNQLVEIAGDKVLASGFSLRRDFPNEWHGLRQSQEVTLTIDRDRLPYFASAVKSLKITGATWVAASSAEPALTENGTTFSTTVKWTKDVPGPGLWAGESNAPPTDAPLPWTTPNLSVSDPKKQLEDLTLVITYELSTQP